MDKGEQRHFAVTIRNSLTPDTERACQFLGLFMIIRLMLEKADQGLGDREDLPRLDADAEEVDAFAIIMLRWSATKLGEATSAPEVEGTLVHRRAAGTRQTRMQVPIRLCGRKSAILRHRQGQRKSIIDGTR